MSPLNIDDGQASSGDTGSARDDNAFVVGTPVNEAIRHGA
jgi:hypothetical protein